MYLQTLKNLMISKNSNAAEVAKRAGMSRAAVSKWFQQNGEVINVETKTLFHLAESFGISPAEFVQPISSLSAYKTLFLWDQLYPSMESFIAELRENRLPAIARLVQVLGFHQASRVLGTKILKWFPRYKKFIKPKRRAELEILWPLYHSQK